MRELTEQELKKAQLNILKDVAYFCETHNIRYSLCGGTLLGAIRHNGFIPWDDDIDIFMPRPDFIKFMESYNGTNRRYRAESVHNDKRFQNKMGQVYDLETVTEYPSYRVDESMLHVFIDIFPLDGIPSNPICRTVLSGMNAALHAMYGGSIYSYVKSMRYIDQEDALGTFKEHIRTAVKFLFITIFRPIPTSCLCRLATRMAMQYPYETCEYIAAYIGGRYNLKKEIMPKHLFEKMEKHVFEDGEFYVTKAYDLYLSNLYGDYMKLPPKEKQVSHHDFTAYWKDGFEPASS